MHQNLTVKCQELIVLISVELKCICNNNFKLAQKNIFRGIEDQSSLFRIIRLNHAAFDALKK